MSIILIDKSKSDKQSLLDLITNSTCKLSDELGKNGLVIELNNIRDTPYSKLIWDETNNNIDISPVNNFIIKIAIIGGEGEKISPHIFGGSTFTTEALAPYGRRSHTIFLATREKFNKEILTQKLVFMQSCMIDCQLRGICVDCVSSFIVDNSRIRDFFLLLNIPGIVDLIDEIVNMGSELGCILMEKMGPSLKQYSSYISSLGNNDEKIKNINNYMKLKANSLICVDKLHYLGIEHYDVKPDNIVDGILIDFGESYGIDTINSTSSRKRIFNSLIETDNIYEYPDITNVAGQRPLLSTDPNYIIDSIFALENIRLTKTGKCHGAYREFNTTTELCDYYDFFEKRPYSETISGKGTRQKSIINFKEKYPAINIMNEIDIANVKRGNNILTFLLDFKCGHVCSTDEKQKYLSEFIDKDKNLIYRIANKKQYGYYSLLNYYVDNNPSKFSCFNILLYKDVNCIDLFSKNLHDSKSIRINNNLNEGSWYPGHAGGFLNLKKTRRKRGISRKNQRLKLKPKPKADKPHNGYS
jgi:hypothetical protein